MHFYYISIIVLDYLQQMLYNAFAVDGAQSTSSCKHKSKNKKRECQIKKLIALALALVLAASAFCIQAFAYRAITGIYQGYEWEGRSSFPGDKKSFSASIEYDGYKNVKVTYDITVRDKSGHPISTNDLKTHGVEVGYRTASVSYRLTGKYSNFFITNLYGTFSVNGQFVGGY